MQPNTGLAYALPKINLARISRQWRPKIRFEIPSGRYIIKTAQTEEEFEATIRLRSEVFLREFAGLSQSDEVDVDDIDLDADFLIVKDQRSEEVLACYRLISSRFADNFYSQSEFSLNDFLRSEGNKLELSRACIRADKRSSGIFLHLLWKGLTKYILLSDATHLFGCSSVQSIRLPEIVSIYHSLNEMSALSTQFNVTPHSPMDIIETKRLLRIPTSEKAELPPLLMGYLKAGAKIHGEPAYDHEFRCLDLFTVLDCKRTPTAFFQKYVEGF